jgi:hypothetical protein
MQIPKWEIKLKMNSLFNFLDATKKYMKESENSRKNFKLPSLAGNQIGKTMGYSR